MNRFRTILAAVLLLTLTSGPVVAATPDDAPIRLESNSYGIESFFFGNTGTVYSYSASIPPVITAGPAVTTVTETTATVVWQTDKLADAMVYLGLESGDYTEQIGDGSAAILATNHSITLNRLTKGTTYYFKVRSIDSDGNVVQSSESQFSTDAGDITAPIITVGPLISVDSASLVTISWETDEPSSTLVDYGLREVVENTLGRPEELTRFHQVRISGLTPAQAYLWRVRSRDASGNTATSATQQLATPNSPFISGFEVSDVTLSSAVVQWITSTASTTKVEYGTATSAYTQTITDAAFTTSHTIRLPELVSGTTYYLRVSGVDQAGNLLQSDEKVFATVVIPQITNLTVSGVTERGALVTWQSSSAIDELLRFEITAAGNPALVGKRGAGGSDTNTTDHVYSLEDLESDAVYSLTVFGKDQFGNQAISAPISFRTLPDQTPPQIVTIKSDTTVDLGSRQTVQVLVSIELSEMAMVRIDYGPNATGPYTDQVITDTQFSRAKFMVIPRLLPGQTYHYRIVVTDRAGNETISPDYLVLAPSQPISLLDLIVGQISANFGWLSNL
jgi:hypothetical protein